MSRAVLIARARIAAERGMVDTCTIRRRTGETTDPGSGTVTPTYLDPHPYTGPCRVQQRSVSGRPDDSGEAALLMVQREVHLPVMTSTGVRADDEVVITAVAAESDPALLNKVFVVRGEAAKTYASARRLTVDEVTS